MTRSVLNGKNLPCFENVNMFTKLHEPINQDIRLNMVLHTSKWNDSNAKFPSPCLISTKGVVSIFTVQVCHIQQTF